MKTLSNRHPGSSYLLKNKYSFIANSEVSFILGGWWVWLVDVTYVPVNQEMIILAIYSSQRDTVAHLEC